MAGGEGRKKILNVIVKKPLQQLGPGQVCVFSFCFLSGPCGALCCPSLCSQAAKPHWKKSKSEVMLSSIFPAALTVGNSHTMEQEASSSYRQAANGFDTTHPTYPSWEEPDIASEETQQHNAKEDSENE